MRRLEEFNFSLLQKWCWRMLIDKEGLVSCLKSTLWRGRGATEGGG